MEGIQDGLIYYVNGPTIKLYQIVDIIRDLKKEFDEYKEQQAEYSIIQQKLNADLEHHNSRYKAKKLDEHVSALRSHDMNTVKYIKNKHALMHAIEYATHMQNRLKTAEKLYRQELDIYKSNKSEYPDIPEETFRKEWSSQHENIHPPVHNSKHISVNDLKMELHKLNTEHEQAEDSFMAYMHDERTKDKHEILELLNYNLTVTKGVMVIISDKLKILRSRMLKCKMGMSFKKEMIKLDSKELISTPTALVCQSGPALMSKSKLPWRVIDRGDYIYVQSVTMVFIIYKGYDMSSIVRCPSMYNDDCSLFSHITGGVMDDNIAYRTNDITLDECRVDVRSITDITKHQYTLHRPLGRAIYFTDSNIIERVTPFSFINVQTHELLKIEIDVSDEYNEYSSVSISCDYVACTYNYDLHNMYVFDAFRMKLIHWEDSTEQMDKRLIKAPPYLIAMLCNGRYIEIYKPSMDEDIELLTSIDFDKSNISDAFISTANKLHVLMSNNILHVISLENDLW
jgi:hypothetical protein